MEGILIPQQVFVGDSAEFLFPIEALDSFEPEILTSDVFKINSIKQNVFMEITSIQIKRQEKKDYISISFTPWEIGIISFPALDEAGIHDRLPQVFISSILDSTKTEVLQPPRTPMLIPGTSYLLYLIASASGVLIFIIVMLLSVIRKYFFMYSNSRFQRCRIRALNKLLKKLKRQVVLVSDFSGGDIIKERKDWLKNFEFAFRRYCISLTASSLDGKKYDVDSFTYSEILNKLKIQFENSYGVYFEFEKLFSRLRVLRFGTNDLKKINFEMEAMYFLNESFKLIRIAESEIQKITNSQQDEKAGRKVIDKEMIVNDQL